MSRFTVNSLSTSKGLAALAAFLTGVSAGFYGLISLVALALGCAVTTGIGAAGLALYAGTLLIAGFHLLRLASGLLVPSSIFVWRNLTRHQAV